LCKGAGQDTRKQERDQIIVLCPAFGLLSVPWSFPLRTGSHRQRERERERVIAHRSFSGFNRT